MSKNVASAVTGSATGSKGAEDGQIMAPDTGAHRHDGRSMPYVAPTAIAKEVPASVDGVVTKPRSTESAGWIPVGKVDEAVY